MGEFVVFQNYGSTVEAEMHAEILREAGIAAILQAPHQGIFGAGFSGSSVQGVTLMVREEDFDRAADLIGTDEPQV
jgi:hypothetical protein